MGEISKTRGENQKVRQGHNTSSTGREDVVLEMRPQSSPGSHSTAWPSASICPHHPGAPGCSHKRTLGKTSHHSLGRVTHLPSALILLILQDFGPYPPSA